MSVTEFRRPSRDKGRLGVTFLGMMRQDADMIRRIRRLERRSSSLMILQIIRQMAEMRLQIEALQSPWWRRAMRKMMFWRRPHVAQTDLR